MLGRRQPNSLEELSLGRVCRQVDDTCRKLQKLAYESSAAQVLAYAKQEIRPYYVKALPGWIRSRVIEETSRMLYGPDPDGLVIMDGPAPLYLLALLLSPDIKQLKVSLCCYYGCSHQKSMLKLLATEGVGLESLNLSRPALLRLDNKLLRSALQSTKNLQSLTMHKIATDSILAVIGKACPRLVVLDVSHSNEVTDIGVERLLVHVLLKDKDPPPHHQQQYQDSLREKKDMTTWSRIKALFSKLKMKRRESMWKEGVFLEYCEIKNLLCNTLKVLNVTHTKVTTKGIRFALANLPNLKSIAEFNDMGRVAEAIKQGVLNNNTPINLTAARTGQATSRRQLELIAEASPRIEELHLFERHQSAEALRLFPRMKGLTLANIPEDFLGELYDFLRSHGENLLYLHLCTDDHRAPLELDLRAIFLYCPNLQRLITEGTDTIWRCGPDPPPLKDLRRIELGCTICPVAAGKILTLVPDLVVLHLHQCDDLTDWYLEPVFSPRKPWDENFGKNLRIFFIYEASQLTPETVLNIFKLYKNLDYVGNLANWGMNCEDVRKLRSAADASGNNVSFISTQEIQVATITERATVLLPGYFFF